MRVGWLLLLVGCGPVIRSLTPTDPMLSATAARSLGPSLPSGVAYTGPPRSPVPLPPVQVWGLTYDLDLVFKVKGRYDMHELARLTVPSRPEPLWLLKSAWSPEHPDPSRHKEQEILADLSGLQVWLPEIPVRRHHALVDVVETGTDRFELTASARVPDGDSFAATWSSGPFGAPRPARNGNPMGHSACSLMVALDLSHQRLMSTPRSRVTVDGVLTPLVRVLGQPVRAALAQTQAGFSTGLYEAIPTDHGLHTAHRLDGTTARQDWQWVRDQATGSLSQQADLRTISYVFLTPDADTAELAEARVTQFAQPSSAVHVRFDPALPDARRPFEGKHTSTWTMGVGGQHAHAVGTATMRWSDANTVVVDLEGTAPTWVAERPIRVTIAHGDDRATLTALRVGPDAARCVPIWE